MSEYVPDSPLQTELVHVYLRYGYHINPKSLPIPEQSSASSGSPPFRKAQQRIHEEIRAGRMQSVKGFDDVDRRAFLVAIAEVMGYGDEAFCMEDLVDAVAKLKEQAK